MATATIQVAAVTSPNQWTLGAGANKVVAVNGPHDGDASYLSSTTTWKQQYSLAAHSIPAGAVINSVAGVMMIRFSVGALGKNLRIDLKLGGNTSNGPVHTTSSFYITYTDVIARPGGGSWSLADLASLEVALVQAQAGAGTVQRCSSLWVIVDYTPPANTGQMLQMFR